MKMKKTDMGGKKLIFVFYACGDGGWRAADAALGVKPTEFLCRNFFGTGRIFCPIFWDKKNAMHFMSNRLTMLAVSHVNASPTAPSQLK